jgi:hypothetical protein
MKKMTQTDIEQALAGLKPSDKMADRKQFWSGFRTRAEQQGTGEPASVTLRKQGRAHPLIHIPAIPRWALVAACVMIAVLAGTTRLLQPLKTDLAASVGSWEVLAPHSAVVVINDEATHSTIMWIVDMTTDNTNGDTS